MIRVISRAITIALIAGVVAVWAFTLRPQSLGGPNPELRSLL